MFHVEHIHSNINHFHLDKLHKWGITFPTEQLETETEEVINHMLNLYEHWVDPNYKLLAVAMEHYQDKSKSFLQLSYDHLIKVFHQDAVLKGIIHILHLVKDVGVQQKTSWDWLHPVSAMIYIRPKKLRIMMNNFSNLSWIIFT